MRGKTENTSKHNVREVIETGRSFSYDCSRQITELVKKEKRKKTKKKKHRKKMSNGRRRAGRVGVTENGP